jgi:hypothetical protein
MAMGRLGGDSWKTAARVLDKLIRRIGPPRDGGYLSDA